MKKILINLIIIFMLVVIFNVQHNNKEIKKNTSISNNLAIMLENEKGEYEVSSLNTWPDNEYIYNDVLSYCEKGSNLEWDNNQRTIKVKEISKTDKCYLYFDFNKADYHEKCQNNTLACQIAQKINGKVGENGEELLLHNNQIDSNQDGIADDAGDFSYRYSGDNPDNFVCFGSKEEECPYEFLYRIIGVFPVEINGKKEYRVKLIKSEYITETELGLSKYTNANSYSKQMENITPRVHKLNGVHTFRWIDDNINNNWLNSKIKDKLNDTTAGYLANFDSDWQNFIADTTWIIGGTSFDINGSTASIVYDYEIGDKRLKIGDQNSCVDDSTEYVPCTKELIETEAKVGLMYVSDYAFAINHEKWANVILSEYRVTENKKYNWLYNGFYEFFITRKTHILDSVFHIDSFGYVGGYNQSRVASQTIRPVFYLESNTPYIKGNGTEDNPYRIMS